MNSMLDLFYLCISVPLTWLASIKIFDISLTSLIVAFVLITIIFNVLKG